MEYQSFMRRLQILITLCTVLLVGYFTWDTFAQLNRIDSLSCTSADKYDEMFLGKNTPCNITVDNISGRKSLEEIFGNGYSKEEVFKLKKEVSDSVLRRGIFLDAVVLLTGSFASVTVSKLQSRKGGIYEAKGKNKGKA